MTSHLLICVLSSERPLDGSSQCISHLLPGIDLTAQKFPAVVSMRLSKHWRLRMPISISAMFSQLACLGV
jgi:hypothetical protein